MHLLISNEELYILGCLSHIAMTVTQLDGYRLLTPDFQWVHLDVDHMHRDMNFLQRRGLIKWERNPGETARIYSITDEGRRLLREYLLAETNIFDGMCLDFSLILNAFDVLNRDERTLVVTRRYAALQRKIDGLKEYQNTLDVTNTARLSILEYYLHRLQDELKWMNGLKGSRNS